MSDLASELREVAVTLPDGAVRRYPAGVTGAEVAADISKSLEKAAFAVTIDGRLSDLSQPIEKDVTLAVVTAKDEAPALELIRHDAAHIMARAVQELWPDAKVTIGPVIENGWYYDFDRAEPFTPEDLETITGRMRQIIAAARPGHRGLGPRPGDPALRGAGRELQGGAGRGDPRGRSGPDVLARALAGPLPRAASRQHRAGAGGRLQADVDRRRLLARRLAAADAAADLRGRLPHQGGARGLSAPARGGAEARPPAARQGDGPLPPAAGGAGVDLLASERVHAVAGAGGLYPPAARRRRLCGGEDAAASRTRALWVQSGHWGKFRENMFVVPDEIPGTEERTRRCSRARRS